MTQSSFSTWFERHGATVQGVTAIITALVALSALIGVKVQIDAAARIQQQQSARDIYREFLSLSIAKPEFADPDYCAIKGTPQQAAYENYVDYLLYTSEQVLEVSPDWQPVMNNHLSAHSDYLCASPDWSDSTDAVEVMVEKMKTTICKRERVACDR